MLRSSNLHNIMHFHIFTCSLINYCMLIGVAVQLVFHISNIGNTDIHPIKGSSWSCCFFFLMLQFLASNTINIPTITSNKHALYGVNGDVTGVTGGLPLRDQMPNLSPHWLILHWIGQVGEAKSLRVLKA